MRGLSQNANTRTFHIPKRSVQDVLEAARKRGVFCRKSRDCLRGAAYALLFLGRGIGRLVYAASTSSARAKSAYARRVRSCYVRQPDFEFF